MQKHTFKLMIGAALFALVPTGAFASSHSEAPAINEDPSADNTDLYAWMAPGTRDKLFVVANYIPLEEPSGGPNWKSFSDDVRYEVHITKGRSLNDFVTYRIEFSSTDFGCPGGCSQNDPAAPVIGSGLNFFSQISGKTQTATVKRIAANGTTTTIAQGVPIAPINIGPRTQTVGNALGLFSSATYDDAFAATFITPLNNGGRVFLGPRDDGFYVDLGGVFDLANLRGPGDGDGVVEPGEAQDNVAGYNTHSIALEIPIADIFGATAPVAGDVDDVLGVWANASRRKVRVLKNNGEVETSGPFIQVSRLGLPLVNEAIIGLQNKDRWNASHPSQEVARFGGYFLNPVIVRDADAVGIYGLLGVPDATVAALSQGRTDILTIISLGHEDEANFVIGDVLRVDPAVDSQFPNGRSLQGGAQPNQEQVDVTDVLLNVLLAGDTGQGFGLTDNANENDKDLLATFPFLALPWQSFAQGHGRVDNP